MASKDIKEEIEDTKLSYTGGGSIVTGTSITLQSLYRETGWLT